MVKNKVKGRYTVMVERVDLHLFVIAVIVALNLLSTLWLIVR